MVRRLGAVATATAMLFFAASWLAAPSAQVAAAEGPLAGVDLTSGATATDLATALVGGGITVSNVTYAGSPLSAGTFSGGTAPIGFAQGVVLSSGRVQRTAPASCSGGIAGPNTCTGSGLGIGGPGDPQLDALSGQSTHDATILEFDFVPTFGTVSFDYVFGSEEYNEYVGSGVNDAFGFFVNGTNSATADTGTGPVPVTVDTINGGKPFGVGAVNPSLFRNNSTVDPGPATIDTELDGLTVVLRCEATVNPGATNHIKLAIADGGDTILDSAVFLAASSLVSGVQLTETLQSGAQTGTDLTVAAGEPVTSQGALSGAAIDTATGSVTYRAFTDAACATLHATAGTKVLGASGAIPPSDPVVFAAAGTYYWQATYSGDAGHNTDATDCGAAKVTVTGGATTTTTTVDPGATTTSTSAPTSTLAPPDPIALPPTTPTTPTIPTTATPTTPTTLAVLPVSPSTTAGAAPVTTSGALSPTTTHSGGAAGAVPIADPTKGVTPGGTSTFGGTGFAPLSDGTVTISLPGGTAIEVLGRFTADAFGKALAELRVPAGLAPGVYHVVLEGIDPNGAVRRVVVPVSVGGAGGAAIPRTGTDTAEVFRWALLLVGLGLLAAGQAETVTVRRARRER